MNFRGPKGKLSRHLGIALTPKAEKIMEKRPYPPGQHGPNKRRGKASNYKLQLLEKQKLRAQYNVSEKQMVNYFKKAQKRKGSTGDNLIQQLETRLDAVVFRGGLAKTIYAARQFVNHHHFLVNGKKVNIPSYRLKVGDTVTIKKKSFDKKMFEETLQFTKLKGKPAYLSCSDDGKSVTLVAMPSRDEVPVVCEVTQVIEFYSK